MSGTTKMKIYYYGEGVYNETTQVTQDIFNRPGFFPQRRDQIFKRLIEKGHEIVMTKLDSDFINDPSVTIEPENDGLVVADNPLIAQKLSRVDLFDWIDWYSEMAAKEFGEASPEAERLKQAEAEVFAKATQIVAQGTFIRDFLSEQGWTKYVRVIPNGVDLERFRPPEGSKLPKKPIELVFVGKLTQWYEDLWEFVKVVAKLEHEVVLHIYGAGPVGDDIESKKYPNVVCHGAVPYVDVPKMMAKHDIAVFPVDDDSPCVIPEYFISGLPVIGLYGKYGRLRSLIDENTGDVCTPDNILACIQLFSSPGTYTMLSTGAIHKGKVLSWDIAATTFEEILWQISQAKLETE